MRLVCCGPSLPCFFVIEAKLSDVFDCQEYKDLIAGVFRMFTQYFFSAIEMVRLDIPRRFSNTGALVGPSLSFIRRIIIDLTTVAFVSILYVFKKSLILLDTT